MANAATLKMCGELASLHATSKMLLHLGRVVLARRDIRGLCVPALIEHMPVWGHRTWKGFHFGGRPTMTQRKWVQVGASQLSPGKCARLRFNRVQLEGICLAGRTFLWRGVSLYTTWIFHAGGLWRTSVTHCLGAR